MQYDTLHELINASSSARAYFLSLPVKVQMALHQHNEFIHTAEELHRVVGMMERYQHHCHVRDGDKL